jgi:hypothetical protein
LKKVSGKSRALDLKPNVFQDLPGESKCQISYIHNTLSRSPEWRVFPTSAPYYRLAYAK